MVDGFKLSELTALGTAMEAGDQLYLVRAGESLKATVSQIRITASQITDLTLGDLAALDTVGTTEIDDESVTLDKLADLTEDSTLIGDATNRPIEFLLSALGKSLMQADPADDVEDAADDESASYTGIDNTAVGSVFAQLDDLNALRVAYEDLRTTYNLLLTSIRSLGLIA